MGIGVGTAAVSVEVMVAVGRSGVTTAVTVEVGVSAENGLAGFVM
jgi:precorrin-6B methylase 2